jgi:ferrous iron transport protein A
VNSNIVSLSDLRVGEQGTVIRLEGGHSFIGRMAALGFTPGTAVRIERNPGHGPLIVSVMDTQIALGRGQALNVQVHRARTEAESLP